MRGAELIDIAIVKRVVSGAAQGYRDGLLNWPSRVAPILAAGWGIDGAQVQVDLDRAVRTLLVELVDLTVAGAFD
jgi:hypothetical protein